MVTASWTPCLVSPPIPFSSAQPLYDWWLWLLPHRNLFFFFKCLEATIRNCSRDQFSSEILCSHPGKFITLVILNFNRFTGSFIKWKYITLAHDHLFLQRIYASLKTYYLLLSFISASKFFLLIFNSHFVWPRDWFFKSIS